MKKCLQQLLGKKCPLFKRKHEGEIVLLLNVRLLCLNEMHRTVAAVRGLEEIFQQTEFGRAEKENTGVPDQITICGGTVPIHFTFGKIIHFLCLSHLS